MRGVNKAIIVGALGQDPEIRYMGNGNAVANFTVATSEAWTDKQTNEKKEETTWHRIVAYGRQAEIIGEFCRKGARIYVEGSIHTRKWQDKQTRQDRYSTEVKLKEFQLLDRFSK